MITADQGKNIFFKISKMSGSVPLIQGKFKSLEVVREK